MYPNEQSNNLPVLQPISAHPSSPQVPVFENNVSTFDPTSTATCNVNNASVPGTPRTPLHANNTHHKHALASTPITPTCSLALASASTPTPASVPMSAAPSFSARSPILASAINKTGNANPSTAALINTTAHNNAMAHHSSNAQGLTHALNAPADPTTYDARIPPTVQHQPPTNGPDVTLSEAITYRPAPTRNSSTTRGALTAHQHGSGSPVSKINRVQRVLHEDGLDAMEGPDPGSTAPPHDRSNERHHSHNQTSSMGITLEIPESPHGSISPRREDCTLNSFAAVACAVSTGVKLDRSEKWRVLSDVPLTGNVASRIKGEDILIPSAQPEAASSRSPSDPHGRRMDEIEEERTEDAAIPDTANDTQELRERILHLEQELARRDGLILQLQAQVSSAREASRKGRDRFVIPAGAKTERRELEDGSEVILVKRSHKRKGEEADLDACEVSPRDPRMSDESRKHRRTSKEGLAKEQGDTKARGPEEAEKKGGVRGRKPKEDGARRGGRNDGTRGAPVTGNKRQKVSPSGANSAARERTGGPASSLVSPTSTHGAECGDSVAKGRGPGAETRVDGAIAGPNDNGHGGESARSGGGRPSRRGSGKRKRDNWTEEENKEFMRLVVESEHMEEMELRRMLTRKFQPRRSHEQCANHLRILRAQGRLPAAKEDMGVTRNPN